MALASIVVIMRFHPVMLEPASRKYAILGKEWKKQAIASIVQLIPKQQEIRKAAYVRFVV